MNRRLRVTALLGFALSLVVNVASASRLDVSRFPQWARVLAIAVFAYSVVNICLFAVLYNGNADSVNGEYVLSSHGRVLAHLTEPQYHLHKAIEIRGFSALWLFFYLLPCLYFWFRCERPA
jgi:hypothetical protein